jgi:hypothetical protein
VAQQPQRPFVPHRTPTRPRPAIARGSEFHLAKPFVPGAPTEIPESLPGIDEFLDREPVAASPSATALRHVPGIEDYLETDYEEPDELPPVEHFLDPLPPVSEYSADPFSDYRTPDPSDVEHPRSTAEQTIAESEWLATEWQNFDWRAAAALGETGATEASNAWSTTDWGAASPRPKERGKTAAHAIAKALDEIAQRIRDGDLAVPGPGAMTDPATIAATLAALLGIRE